MLKCREFYGLALVACFLPKYKRSSWIISLQVLYYLCKTKDKIPNFILYLSSGLDVQHVYFSSIYSSLSLMFVTNVPPCQEMYVENCFVRLSYDIDVPSLTMVLN